ncbi:MAG: type I-E CRISPR-associated protein Cas7/Cse4/CasC [Pyrinomonadaceae bacterium]|nr:type I-E CRISPR-associated protein Cas7/Cse4/CasC [Pyrinomonadaceae bacterium]
MFIELHILQNFAPSNLNRDDTGSPKDCEFGGYRRARISSQCFKRAIRETFKTEQLLDESLLASRTKRLVEEITSRLKEKGKPEDQSKQVIEMILNGVKLSVKDDGKTQYLLFISEKEINRIAELCEQHWELLTAAIAAANKGDQAAKKGKGKDAKKVAQAAVPDEIKKSTLALLDGGKAADLALFGRMLADLPDKNIDAASQVAHAISTNKVSVEFDFYTAVDDLKPDDTQGADMLGTVEFNSACFYRYANVDLDQLRENLDDDEELTRKTLEAFLRASIAAVPTGKQNSMAAQNPPSFVLAVARKSGLWSLVNAFVDPATPRGGDLVNNSVNKLGDYWKGLVTMYGSDQITGKCYLKLAGDDLAQLNGSRVANVDELVKRMLTPVQNGAKGE